MDKKAEKTITVVCKRCSASMALSPRQAMTKWCQLCRAKEESEWRARNYAKRKIGAKNKGAPKEELHVMPSCRGAGLPVGVMPRAFKTCTTSKILHTTGDKSIRLIEAVLRGEVFLVR